MLVIHRFTQNMVREYKSIKKHPEVQIIVDMDGWGLRQEKSIPINNLYMENLFSLQGSNYFIKMI